MTTSPRQISLFTEEQLISLREDFHVNHTQRQESDSGKRMNATYGRKCLEQFERFNRVGLWAKTFAGLLIGMEGWYSRRCKLTWRLRGTKYNRLYFLLQVSTLRMKDTALGLLPTPQASDDGRIPKENWSYHGNYYKTEAGKKVQTSLSVLAKGGMLPTPAAQNYKGANSIEALKARGRYKEKADNLADQFAISGATSQLNPLFVSEMMGFPNDWLVLPFQGGETKA